MSCGEQRRITLEARELDRRNVARRERPSLTSGLAAPPVARQAAGLDIVTVGCASTFGLLLFFSDSMYGRCSYVLPRRCAGRSRNRNFRDRRP